jgi:hypothetical protein
LAEGQTDQLPAGGAKWDEREWDIPTWFWSNFTGYGTSRLNWELGKFAGTGVAQHRRQKITLSGVYFLRSSLLPVPVPGEAKSPDIGSNGKRGRQRAYDWEAAVAAVWGAIYRGEFIPDNQAAIERELQRRLANGDREPSESAVRPFASRIWSEIQKA